VQKIFLASYRMIITVSLIPSPFGVNALAGIRQMDNNDNPRNEKRRIGICG
jgi:hypothetical protein